MPRKHNHYFKNVSHLKDIDVYRTLELYGVTDQALGHAIKKLLCAGGRGVKNFERDIQEAIDTLNRRLEMLDEDKVQLDLFRGHTKDVEFVKINPVKKTCINVFRGPICRATESLHLECGKTFEDCKKFNNTEKFNPQ